VALLAIGAPVLGVGVFGVFVIAAKVSILPGMLPKVTLCLVGLLALLGLTGIVRGLFTLLTGGDAPR